MIDPKTVAFDIDGVVADTMNLFIDIAREDYRIDWIRYEDITLYQLEECPGLTIGKDVIDAIITQILDGTYTPALKSIAGASEVLSRLARNYGPVLFVTARPYPGPMQSWICDELSVPGDQVEIIATGSFDAKAEVLVERGVSHFVEDRLDTCFSLEAVGITPILFKQPWNRGEPHPFHEVGSWIELSAIIGDS